MRRMHVPGGLRARLTLLFASVVVLTLAVAFTATYSGTGTEVRRQIDNDLSQDAQTFISQGIPITATTPKSVAKAVTDYVNSQFAFGAGARLYVVRIIGHRPITNEPDLLGLAPSGSRERRRGAADARRLLSAPLGYSTVQLAQAGPVRMYVHSLPSAKGDNVGVVGIGEPLGAVSRAKSSVARTFVLTGLIVAALALVVGWLVSSGISRPLRRMARTVAHIDAGELQHRVGQGGPRDEVRTLAEAFDRMLDRLEDAFSRQRAFVSDASHELRTPLTVIRGQLEVLARQPEVTVEDVGRVERTVLTEILRMERLVEDLLLLARADEGELIRPEPLELDPFVTELFDGLTLTANRRFELGTLPGGVISADADRIAQVVRNLFRNAVEHTSEGDGLVRLTVLPKGGGGVEFAVEDDGPGIPVAQRDRVFDRFQRTDTARARAGGGAGLGLAIARAIVEAHRGRIYAGTSTAGGARVAFELPGYARPRPASPRERATQHA
ncbi:MAG: integral rane sensor signal transduction histidine kinase [Solirubrobacterales bacterium]|nr:integral rane sensor signal transduction histidine kinase [Solirubrobacterales bacterium]